MTAKELANQINEGGTSCQVEKGQAFAKEVIAELKALGWKNAKMLDTCTKASFEAQLQNKKSRVRITTAHFMGVFTQFDVTRG